MLDARYRLCVLTIVLGFGGLMVASSAASAGPVSDVADGMNDALFGGENLFAAQAILTAAVMVATGLLLAMLRLEKTGIMVVLICVLGGLTAIGWADPMLLLVCGLLIGLMFVKKAAEQFTGGNTSSDES